MLKTSLLLALASAAVALLPFRFAIRIGCVPVDRKRGGTIERSVQAVEIASRRLPWRTMCIEKGLVVQRLLRSGGIDAVLHYGARHDPDLGILEAHVWITADGEAVIGGPEAADFAELASYP